MTAKSHSRATVSPMGARLPASRLPPHPNRHTSRPAQCARNAERDFSNPSGVCAKSTNTSAPRKDAAHSSRPSTPGSAESPLEISSVPAPSRRAVIAAASALETLCRPVMRMVVSHSSSQRLSIIRVSFSVSLSTSANASAGVSSAKLQNGVPFSESLRPNLSSKLSTAYLHRAGSNIFAFALP